MTSHLCFLFCSHVICSPKHLLLHLKRFIFVERPIATCSSQEKSITVIKLSDNSIDETSRSSIKASLVHRANRDGVLSKFLGSLYCGRNPRPLVSFDDLFPRLHSSPPLLPGHHVYMDHVFGKSRRRDHISVDQIDGIVTKNAFGARTCDDLANTTTASSYLAAQFTSLLVAASMLNHDKDPNCELLGALQAWQNGAPCMFRTVRPIAAGEELTIQYHDDERALKNTWGISS